jgi:hypothetical protein
VTAEGAGGEESWGEEDVGSSPWLGDGCCFLAKNRRFASSLACSLSRSEADDVDDMVRGQGSGRGRLRGMEGSDAHG